LPHRVTYPDIGWHIQLQVSALSITTTDHRVTEQLTSGSHGDGSQVQKATQ